MQCCIAGSAGWSERSPTASPVFSYIFTLVDGNSRKKVPHKIKTGVVNKEVSSPTTLELGIIIYLYG